MPSPRRDLEVTVEREARTRVTGLVAALVALLSLGVSVAVGEAAAGQAGSRDANERTLRSDAEHARPDAERTAHADAERTPRADAERTPRADAERTIRPDAERASVEVSGDADAAPGDGTVTGAAPSDDEMAELVDALDGLSAAVASGDPDRVAEHLDDPASEVGERWRRRTANLAGVDLEHYRLRVDGRLGEVTSDRVRARHDTDVVVLVVVEELTIAGHDRDGAGRHRRTLTFVRRDDGWRLSDETDGRALGLSTPVHLWDLGPVATTGDGPVVALHHPDAPDIGQLVEETTRGIATLREQWPASWSERVVLIVPRDGEELDELLDADLHLDDFLAFATATAWSEPGVHDLVGSRVVVNPSRFDDLRPEVRERVLLHELLHVATRPLGTAAMPLWLEEGVAQALGEQGPSTGTTGALDRLGADGRRLPDDEDFTAGGRDQTHLAYQRSWSFVDHLVQTHGPEAVAAFYAEVGEASTSEGTVEHQIDAAAQEVLGSGLDELVSRWRSAG
jgi:hypothetical protein